MSKLIEKRIASAESKLSAAHPSLKIRLTDLGSSAAAVGVVVKHGRTAIVDSDLDRSFGVRELVAAVDRMIERAVVTSGRTLDQDDATAQGRAAEDPEPLLADTPPDDDVIDAEIHDYEPTLEEQVSAQVDHAISQAIADSNRGALVLNIDVAVRFVDLRTAHVVVFGGEHFSVAALSELATHAIAEKVGDFVSWGYMNSWREPGKHAVTVQMRRFQ